MKVFTVDKLVPVVIGLMLIAAIILAIKHDLKANQEYKARINADEAQSIKFTLQCISKTQDSEYCMDVCETLPQLTELKCGILVNKDQTQ